MRYFTHSSSIIVFAASINAASRKYFAAVFAMPSLFLKTNFLFMEKLKMELITLAHMLENATFPLIIAKML